MKSPKVFISYSQDSKTHIKRVFDLTNHLRYNGIDCDVDMQEKIPLDPWYKWCRKKITEAKYVLIIITKKYRQKIDEEVAEDEGRGVKYEWTIIEEIIYQNGGKNEKFIPIFLSQNERKYLPHPLIGATNHLIREESYADDLRALYRTITDQNEYKFEPLGDLIEFPTEHITKKINLNETGFKENKSQKVIALGKNEKGFEEFKCGKDHSVMIKIPSGKFWMGSVGGEGKDNERPQRQIYLDEYYIDKYAVTNKQFDLFVEDTDYRTEAEIKGTGFITNQDGRWEVRKGINWRDYYNKFTENHPVVLVSPIDVAAYCKWANKRLPTEAEWEKASRGTEGNKYPWGNTEPNETLVNYGAKIRTTVPVDELPQGSSPYGCFNMAGNVWEWCSDFFQFDYYTFGPVQNPKGPKTGDKIVNRGGSWFSDPFDLRCAYRIGDDPISYFHLGFRCAISQKL